VSPTPAIPQRVADSRSSPEPRVLRHVPTPVTVVCTLDGDHPVGHTIGSFVSVSLDPPLVGYFAMRWSGTLAAVRRSGRFSVNVLGAHQVEVGRRFADRSAEPFAGVPWEPGDLGCPHLAGAVAVLDCGVEQVVAVGDHELVVGRVFRTVVAPGDPDPLVFAGGRFRALAGGAPLKRHGDAAIDIWERTG
jgi:3-hydroxy-9,10-secoandrosta-1,3,5(10)-triene-9,17-dione monooxygenase reductase component